MKEMEPFKLLVSQHEAEKLVLKNCRPLDATEEVLVLKYRYGIKEIFLVEVMDVRIVNEGLKNQEAKKFEEWMKSKGYGDLL